MRLKSLGSVSVDEFIRDYWGKKPVLIRSAFAFGDTAPIDKTTLLKLCTRDDLNSRLIQHMPAKSAKTKASASDVNAGHWQLDEGPFDDGFFESTSAQREAKKGVKFTVLVQDTNHVHAGADALLQQFSFIPHARLDDLMVSYAIDGAGVGAHVDSYDVFLLQGWGKRHWQWSHQADLSLKEDAPLKLLNSFHAEFSETLEPGDMLYLPAGWAHYGVAVGECLTYSIGFRSPTGEELQEVMVDTLANALKPAMATAADHLVDLQSPRKGHIPSTLTAAVSNATTELLSRALTPKQLTGRLLTFPKLHVEFVPPTKPQTLANFTKLAFKNGIRLDAKTRALYDDETFYINGQVFDGALTEGLRALADDRSIDTADTALAHRLFVHYETGELHLGTAKA